MAVATLFLLRCRSDPPASTATPGPTVAEAPFTHLPLWNDGKAEVAFYRARVEEQEVDVGTYFLKQDFDPARESKANERGVSAFKWAVFFEIIRGTEQFKHSIVVNATQTDLRPLKVSSNSFDWCSNQYQELSILTDGTIKRLMRSDDYGNDARTTKYRAKSYPVAQIPLLVRAMDFRSTKEHDFLAIRMNGTYVDAKAKLI